MFRRVLGLFGLALPIVLLMTGAAMADAPRIDARLDQPIRTTGVAPISKLDRSLVGRTGTVEAVVRLAAAPTSKVGGGAVKAQLRKIGTQQTGVEAALSRLDGSAVVLGKTRVALNALLVEADAKALARLAKDPRVQSVSRVRDYRLALSETVPWIGAADLHARTPALTGAGVTVAVLDTGIDYTHAAFGGPGTVEAYRNAYGKTFNSGQSKTTKGKFEGTPLFPSAKVIGGYDFVGERWPEKKLKPDPDPIDCSPAVVACTGGHGTHVADIIAGLEVPGSIGKGVAPGAQLYALKVCSSISPSCSGVALLQAMDFALDPNGDGNTSDHVDIINMSLGSLYGQSTEDSLSAAVENATAAGALTVAAAGNAADKPYIVDTPAASPSALGVAQTTVPSATVFAMLLSTNAGTTFTPREAVHQPWSKPFEEADEVTNVPVQYGDGANGNLEGCSPFAPGSLSGKVVLVDRGTCNFSEKIANIANGGGKIGVIGLVAPGEPFTGALGVCPDNACANIPGFMVSQSTSTAMKGANARVTFDLDNQVPIPLHTVGSSSRGPDNALNLIKPEIGAPGASVSAEVGTGTDATPFGGTSGATPMVAGAAALLKEAYPSRSPLELKAALITTGETDIFNRPAVFGGDLAPITRIGGGEVRANRAFDAQAAAWEQGGASSALSFGFHDISADSGNTFTKTVLVRNYGGTPLTFDVSSTFRFANDASNGAVTVTVPPSVVVPANGTATFDVTLSVDGSSLRAWSLESGLTGASPGTLQLLEYDGYVWLDAGGAANDIHLPWQILPRQAGNVTATPGAPGVYTLTNGGVGDASIGSFGLVATSPQLAPSGPGDDLADVDLRYVGVRSFTGAVATAALGCDVPVGLSFATTTWARTVHANAPALFEFDLDIDRDGEADFAVYNFDLSDLNDGRNITWALDLATGEQTAFFFAQHSTNSANTILTVCGEQIGLDADSIGDSIDVVALAADHFNSATVTDVAEFTMVVGGDRYQASFAGAGPFSPFGTFVGAGSTDTLTLTDLGATGRNPTETGLLLLLDSSLFGPGGSPADNATLILP